ncbi:MAG: hypothetical protein R3A11_06125 [Bdellovibrionota bacterium]
MNQEGAAPTANLSLYYPHQNLQSLKGYEIFVEDLRKMNLEQRIIRAVVSLSNAPDLSLVKVYEKQQFELKNVFLKDGNQVFLEFRTTSSISEGKSLREEELCLLALLKTLFENFPSLSTISLLLDGQYRETLWGKLWIRPEYDRRSIDGSFL